MIWFTHFVQWGLLLHLKIFTKWIFIYPKAKLRHQGTHLSSEVQVHKDFSIWKLHLEHDQWMWWQICIKNSQNYRKWQEYKFKDCFELLNTLILKEMILLGFWRDQRSQNMEGWDFVTSTPLFRIPYLYIYLPKLICYQLIFVLLAEYSVSWCKTLALARSLFQF